MENGRFYQKITSSHEFLGQFAHSGSAGILLGIGIMAAVDEIIFHQLLAWHHFYDLSTPEIGLLSDGILHALELTALVSGFFILFDTKRKE